MRPYSLYYIPPMFPLFLFFVLGFLCLDDRMVIQPFRNGIASDLVSGLDMVHNQCYLLSSLVLSGCCNPFF